LWNKPRGESASGAALRLLAAVPRRKAVLPRDLSQDLERDAGHLSRLLSKLERHGMIERQPTADRRQSAITLTAFGRFTLRRHQQRREIAVTTLLDGLPSTDRGKLADAMARSGEMLAKLESMRSSQHPRGRQRRCQFQVAGLPWNGLTSPWGR
jgi:DNA-binding MarR family transcriptional regulator